MDKVRRGFFLIVLSSLLLLLCCSAIGSAAPAPIQVDARPGVSSTHVKYATLAINDMVRFFADNYHIALHKKLRIILVPDDKEYINVLVSEFGNTPATAVKLAKTTGGMAKEAKGEYKFVVKARQSAAMDDFMKGACHELVHWYQYQAGGDKKSAQIKWLLEGSANVIAYQIVETHVNGTIDKYHRRSLNVIKKASTVPPLRELYSRKDWLAAMDRYGTGVVYSKAELAVSEIAQRLGFKALFQYFLNLKNSSHAQAFERAFGLNLKNFENAMDQKMSK
jgi:hypothetical protein